MNVTRKLELRAFGEANLAFLNVPLTDVNRTVEINKRADGHRYTVKTDGSGLIEIEYDENNNKFEIALFNRSRWYTTISIEGVYIKVGNTTRAHSTQVVNRYVTANETRNIHTTFKLVNRSDAKLHRLDVRGFDTQWFSVFSNYDNLLMVRPNGDWCHDRLIQLIDQTSTQAINNYRRTNGESTLNATETNVMQRRRQTQKQTEEAATQTRNVRFNEPERQKPSQSRDTASQTKRVDIDRVNQLLADEMLVERRTEELQQKIRQHNIENAQFEMDSIPYDRRMQKLRMEIKELEDRKKAINNEVNDREIVLEKRKKILQEEKERYNKERAEFDDMIENMPRLIRRAATAEQNTQTDWPKWSHFNTGITLTDRFSQANMDFMQRFTRKRQFHVKENFDMAITLSMNEEQ